VPSFNSQIRRPDYAVGSILLGGKHVLTTTGLSGCFRGAFEPRSAKLVTRTVSFNAEWSGIGFLPV